MEVLQIEAGDENFNVIEEPSEQNPGKFSIKI